MHPSWPTTDVDEEFLIHSMGASVFICESESASLLVMPDSLQLLDYNPPDFSLHGIFPARILEWVAIPFSRVPSWPKGWSQVSCIAGRFFIAWATGEAPMFIYIFPSSGRWRELFDLI